MAKPKNLSKPRDLPLKVPAECDDYLILLATLGKFGFTRTDVAVEILVRETHRLDNEKFGTGPFSLKRDQARFEKGPRGGTGPRRLHWPKS